MSQLLDEINIKLIEFKNNNPELNIRCVKYGAMPAGESDIKNYIVFNRSVTSRSGTSKTDFNKYYEIHLVHEDFIPEDSEFTLINKILEIPGIKLASNDIEYDYAIKSKTKTVVEIATITFTKALKGVVKLV